MDKCPFCDFEIEPEDATFKELASHVVRNHEYVSLEKLLMFMDTHNSPRYFIFCLCEELDNLKTERWYNS